MVDSSGGVVVCSVCGCVGFGGGRTCVRLVVGNNNKRYQWGCGAICRRTGLTLEELHKIEDVTDRIGGVFMRLNLLQPRAGSPGHQR